MTDTPGSSFEAPGLRWALVALLALVALRMGIGLVPIPVSALGFANLLVSVLFVAIPVLGLLAGSAIRWSWATASACVLVGGGAQIGLSMLITKATPPLAAGMLTSIAQSFLLVWILGLGALVAGLFKDKNLLLPVAVFLGLFDIWLVFADEGPVGKVLKGSGDALKRIAFQVPQAAAEPTSGMAQPLIYIGPADFLFITMFFVAMFRFKMRVRATMLALIPTLFLYLLVVLLFGHLSVGPFLLRGLPALVPIGGVFLAVNAREFQLTTDEKASTLVIAVLGALLVGWRLYLTATRPTPPAKPSAPVEQAGPSKRSDVPTTPATAPSPG